MSNSSTAQSAVRQFWVDDRSGHRLYPRPELFAQTISQRAALRRFADGLKSASSPLEQKIDEYFETHRRNDEVMAILQSDLDGDDTQPVKTIITDEPDMEKYIRTEVIVYSRREEEFKKFSEQVAFVLCVLCGVLLEITAWVAK